MNNKNGERKNATLAIDQIQYGQLEREARKRALAPGDYLEMLIEMDYITNTGSDPGETVSVSISEKHYSLLCREAEEVGRGVGEAAEMIIGLSAEALPEKPLSRERFDAVVEAWGGIDFPSGENRKGARPRGNSSRKSS